MKREFKDLMVLEQYDCLNSEITGDYDKAHAVKCVNGTFVGTENHGVASWLGIPYAKAPVGNRRFKAQATRSLRPNTSERVLLAHWVTRIAFRR